MFCSRDHFVFAFYTQGQLLLAFSNVLHKRSPYLSVSAKKIKPLNLSFIQVFFLYNSFVPVTVSQAARHKWKMNCAFVRVAFCHFVSMTVQFSCVE